MTISNRVISLSNLKFAGLVILIIFILIAIAGSAAAEITATPMVITTFDDVLDGSDGLCSLREAVIASNNRSASSDTPGECQPNTENENTILLPPGLYQLTRLGSNRERHSDSGDLDIWRSVTIESQGPGLVVINADYDHDRVFEILGKTAHVTLRGLTITGGHAPNIGGGILNNGILEIENATLTGNRARRSGGGLYTRYGTATLTNVTISENDAPDGSGLHISNGQLNIVNSMIVNDSCSGPPMEAPGGPDINLQFQASDCAPEVFGISADHYFLQPLEIDGLEGTAVLFGIPSDSPATDMADDALCPDFDQVGTPRPPEACDIGAFEAEEANQSPVAADQNLSVAEDGEILFSLSVTDDNDDIDWNSFNRTSGPSYGTLAGPDVSNQFTYRPNSHYSGDDDGDFDDDSFTYEIFDGDGVGPATAVVNIEVVPNDAYIEVTNVCDSGPGSLRAAINAANDPLVPADIIIFDIFTDASAPDYCGADTINLQSALPPIDLPVTIDGLATDDDTEFPVVGGAPHIVLEGHCGDFSGLTISGPGGGSIVANLAIQAMGGSGIVIGDVSVDGSGASNGNTIADNIISGNGCSPTPVEDQDDPNILYNDGATIVDGVENRFEGNDIFNNAGESIDLKGDGPTPNDDDDEDIGPNYQQNYQHISAATPDGVIKGFLESVPTLDTGEPKMFALEFWMAPTCYADSAVPLEFTYVNTNTDGGNEYVITDANGYVGFTINVSDPMLIANQVVFGTSRDVPGNTSEYSDCRLITENNTVWTQSQVAAPQSTNAAASPFSANAINALDPADFDIYDEVTDQAISEFGQSRWYVVKNLKPDTTMIVELTGMTVNLDLTLYSDIQAEYDKLVGPGDPDLNVLGAVAAPDWAAPDWAAPDWAAPDWAAPDWAAPDWADAGLAYDELAAPDWAAPDWAAPDWANTYYAPDVYPSDALVAAPDWAPEDVASSWIDVDAYSSAQTAAIVGVSAFDGVAPERLVLRTFNNQGNYYIRVTGRNGAFDLAAPYAVSMGIEYGVCQTLDFEVQPYGGTVSAGGYETLILVDEERMGAQYPAEMAALNAKLQVLAAATNGIVINVNEDGVNAVSQVAKANAIADANPECIAAKNVVARSVREIIKAYRAANPGIEYLLFVGNDDITPFFRHPDQANLGSEKNYDPPVEDSPLSASEALLRAGNFLSMDLYGASIDEGEILSYKGDVLPLLEIAPARLVETPTEITAVIDAFLNLDDPNVPGISPLPVVLDSGNLGLSVGYDFMKDAAEAISDVLAGTGAYGPLTGLPVNELIGDDWTANDMVDVLSDTGNDPQIAYVGGHYVANGGVAADYKTYFYPKDVINSPQDFANDLFFGNGCHMGYNIVSWHNKYDNGDLVTLEPDWAQAFASRGATLIAGTGYQYGDTDFIEYNERIYLELAKALRDGDGGSPISLGAAFVEAKQRYLAKVPSMRGIHQKSLMQTTIYGLPMIKYDLPGGQVPEITNASIFNSEADLTAASSNPGLALNLHTYELVRDYADSGSPDFVNYLTEQPLSLMDVDTLEEVSVPYLVGPAPASLIQNNVTEPILPRDEVNVTVPHPSTMVLRGVGFRGGVYTDFKRGDEQDESTWKYILTGLSATELNGAHFGFLSDTMFPSAPWNINRFDALTETDPNATGNTMVNVLPAQVQAPLPEPYETTLRQYNDMSFKLFFSDYASPAGPNLPALASAPGIVKVEGLVNLDESVTFNVQVVGDPSAGIQEVWITYSILGVPSLSGTPGAWVSLDLEQDVTESTLWSNPTTPLVLPTGTEPSDVRFMAQACTGTGLCTLLDNFGRHYIPGVDGEGAPTAVTGLSGPSSGAVGMDATFSATLVDANNNALAGLPLFFSLGSEMRFAETDVNGYAEATIPIKAAPGEYVVNATFPGDLQYAQGAAVPNLDFEILQQDTTVTWVPNDVAISTTDPSDMVVELRDVLGNPLAELTVLFKLESPIETLYKAVITDQEGLAPLGEVELENSQTYSVSARFGGTSSYLPSSTSAPGSISPPVVAVEVVAVVENNDGTQSFVTTIWPPNNKPVAIEVRLADDNHTPLSHDYEFLLIEQDEKVKKGPDAAIENSCQTAWVRARRNGRGNGRVYHITFQINYGGTWLPGEGYISVPHDQSGDLQNIDDGPNNGYYQSAECPSPS